MEAAKSSAETRWREAPLTCWPLPGFAEIFCERPGKAKLGVGGDDEPGPAVSGGRFEESGRGPPQRLLEHPEGVLEVESPQECRPEPVHIPGRSGGGRPPQPHGSGAAVAAEVVDLQTDDGAFDDRQSSFGMVGPGRAPDQPRFPRRSPHRVRQRALQETRHRRTRHQPPRRLPCRSHPLRGKP